MARNKLVGVRFSAAEYLVVAAAAEAAGLHPVAWIRRQTLHTAEAQPAPPATFVPPPTASPARLARPASTRLTEEQFRALVEYAKDCGLPVAAYIRRVVLGSHPIPRRPLARSAIVAVNRVGNNLNQLVHLTHMGVVLAPDLVRTLAEVQDQFQALQRALLEADGRESHEGVE